MENNAAKCKFIFILFLLIGLNGMAQEDSPKVIHLEKEVQNKMEFAGVFKSSIGLEFAGKSGLLGVNFDHLFSRYMRLGVGAGYAGAGLDLKFFPIGGIKRGKLRFTVALRGNYVAFPNQNQHLFLSAPIGLFYAGVNRINYEFDLGPLYRQTYPVDGAVSGFTDQLQYLWFSIKVSHRFSFYAMKRERQLKKKNN